MPLQGELLCLSVGFPIALLAAWQRIAWVTLHSVQKGRGVSQCVSQKAWNSLLGEPKFRSLLCPRCPGGLGQCSLGLMPPSVPGELQPCPASQGCAKETARSGATETDRASRPLPPQTDWGGCREPLSKVKLCLLNVLRVRGGDERGIVDD